MGLSKPIFRPIVERLKNNLYGSLKVKVGSFVTEKLYQRDITASLQSAF